MRRWTEKEDAKLISLMEKYLKEGCTASSTMEYAAGNLGRTFSSVRNRWGEIRKGCSTSSPKKLSSYDDIILKTIKKHPHNLQDAFRELSDEIQYSVGYISRYWYEKLRYKESAKCFILVSKDEGYINSKNIIVPQDSLIIKNGRKSIWNRFLSFFKK